MANQTGTGTGKRRDHCWQCKATVWIYSWRIVLYWPLLIFGVPILFVLLEKQAKEFHEEIGTSCEHLERISRDMAYGE